MIGTTILHYRVLEQIGTGGMGVVYLAEDERLRRKVALKFVTAAAADASARTRLLHEAQAASALDHTNIATIYEIGDWDGQSFIAMGYYAGETLRARIDRGPIPLDEAVGIARQIASGLAAAHAAGIVHRDLKPANVMLTSSGQVKILDFGIAKLTAPDRETITKVTGPGVTIGTLAYMAPEQAQAHDVDARADVWSLGVVIYEMVAGRRPFDAETPAGLLLALLTETPRPLSSMRPDVPAALDRIVVRALVKDPAERTVTAADVVRDLAPLPVQSVRRATFAGSRRAAIASVVALAVLAGLFALFARRTASRREAARALLPEIERLIERDDYVAASALAAQAEPALGSDPALGALWLRMSDVVSVRTDPPGADVAICDPTMQNAWRDLGHTPIEGVRLPRGVLRWRIEKAGFQTDEFIGAARGGVVLNGVSAAPIVLTPVGSVQNGMVRIPASALNLTLTGFDYNRTIASPAYLIDRDEVTNKDYKAFVDAGGYEKREYWTQPFVKDGVTIPFEQAIAGFRDQTGRPGPSTWEVGTYPNGQDDYPVGGVSWYEAAAYANWRGESLPTIYHWARGAGPNLAAQVTPLSNFGRKGPMPIGRNRAVTQAGLYDMAGNVKEWCWNETKPGGRRYALGGSWQDADYSFLYPDARSPFDRSAINGFRCVRYDAGTPPAETLAPVSPPLRDFANEHPVSDEVFNVYRNLYAYDQAPLAASTDRVDDSSPLWRKESVSYAATYGEERVPAYLFLPKKGTPPYQAVVYWPGSSSIRTPSSEPLPQVDAIDFLVLGGRAVLYPVYYGSYERHAGRDSTWPERTRAYREWVMRQVADARRSIDYLQSRADIRRDSIGYYGFSWGARMGSIVLALEPRLRAGVLMAGGFSGDPAPELDPFNFAPRVTAPVLMINGDADFIFELERSQKPLFAALGPPQNRKRHVVLPGGHAIIYEKHSQVIREILDWFDQFLGPVR